MKRRYALCIGNNEYEYLPSLKSAVADAKAIANKLLALEFDVDIVFNLNREELNNSIVAIEDKLQEYDVVLFYYAGHGFQVNNENIIVPVDFDDNEELRTAHYRAFPINDLMEILKTDLNKTRIVIFDACRSSLGARGSVKDFAPMVAPQGSLIAFSTSPGQAAKEDNEHGLYTHYLVEHLDEPRVSIETMFKRVRTDLANATSGQQISWEHTSLIGEFQLNPNTIYDGMNYTDDALRDNNYIFDRNSIISSIVNGLDKWDYNDQSEAISRVRFIDYSQVRSDELFVLGRRIYQSACGNCYSVQEFIDRFTEISYVPQEAKDHILNGMAYEIYYDHSGTYRMELEWGYAEKVIRILESDSYKNCLDFVSTRLINEDHVVFYIPGQNNKVSVSVKLSSVDDGVAVVNIVHDGKKIYYKNYIDSEHKEITASDCVLIRTRSYFEALLRRRMGVMTGYLSINYVGYKIDNRTNLLLPEGEFSLFPKERIV